MKQFKLISIILLFLLTFISRAEISKYPSDLKKIKSQKSFTTSKISLISTSVLAYAKDKDVHFTVKKKIKYRAITSESSTLRTPYLIKSTHFKIFKNRLIYGIVAIYQIQRHAYLHLYQLF